MSKLKTDKRLESVNKKFDYAKGTQLYLFLSAVSNMSFLLDHFFHPNVLRPSFLIQQTFKSSSIRRSRIE